MIEPVRRVVGGELELGDWGGRGEARREARRGRRGELKELRELREARGGERRLANFRSIAGGRTVASLVLLGVSHDVWLPAGATLCRAIECNLKVYEAWVKS